MWILIIYLVGVVVAWRIMVKVFRREAKKYENDYDGMYALLAIVTSIVSWIAPFFYYLHKVIMWIDGELSDTKPPKWM